MAFRKKDIRQVAPRNRDIRVRYAKVETLKELAEVGRLLNERNAPAVVVKLIHRYKGDQQLIKQLQARNTQLHATLLKQLNKEDEMRKLLQQFILYTDKFNKMTVDKAKGLLKKLNAKGGRK